MSISGISSIHLFSPQGISSNSQKIQKEFQQLGADLKSGNLSAAQSDLATLRSSLPHPSLASSILQGQNPIAHNFSKLAEDLKSGNLSGARQDYANLRQDFVKLAHHHHGAGGSGEVSQLFQQLGAAIQSGDLSKARQAYGSLSERFEPNSSSQSPGVPGTSPGKVQGAPATSISLTA